MRTTYETALDFINLEAERVLKIADAKIKELKRDSEISENFDEIYLCVKAVEDLNEAVKRFEGDIPDDSWRPHVIIDHMPYFIRSADRVLELCK